MDKTVTVLVERQVMHPLIGKVVTRTKKYHAHNEGNDAKMGDMVVIEECRPLSKTKAWKVARARGAGPRRSRCAGGTKPAILVLLNRGLCCSRPRLRGRRLSLGAREAAFPGGRPAASRSQAAPNARAQSSYTPTNAAFASDQPAHPCDGGGRRIQDWPDGPLPAGLSWRETQ